MQHTQQARARKHASLPFALFVFPLLIAFTVVLAAASLTFACEGCGLNFDPGAGTPTSAAGVNYWGATPDPGNGSQWVWAVGMTLCEGCGPVGYWASPQGEGGPVTPPAQPPRPSCSITFDRNPINGGDSTVIRWSSTNASLFFIRNIGYVSASGSASVAPSRTTDYSGTASTVSGTAHCAAILTVSGTSLNTGPTGQQASGNDDRQPTQACIPSPVCDTTFTKVLNSCTADVMDNCTAYGSAWRCENGKCVAQSMDFRSFDGDFLPDSPRTFTASGHLQAIPSLLRSGGRSRIFWNVVNANACVVTGSNGDSWTGGFSGASGKVTSPIVSMTIYTLRCTAPQGVSPRELNEQVVVNVIPVFKER